METKPANGAKGEKTKTKRREKSGIHECKCILMAAVYIHSGLAETSLGLNVTWCL